MNNRWGFTLFYAMHLIATGLWRSIEARAYKPNSLWFCLILGIVLIISAFLYRTRKTNLARVIATCVTLLVFSFYFYCFVTQPEKDATLRVGLIILSSIAQITAIYFPLDNQSQNQNVL